MDQNMISPPYIANLKINRSDNFQLEWPHEGAKPKSIVVHTSNSRVFFDYGGLEGAGPSSFTIPRNAGLLRKLARALAKEAKEVQDIEDKLAAMRDE
jgi:hypothetical protein